MSEKEVYEGIVRAGLYDDSMVYVGDENLGVGMELLDGKRVRVTIEVLE